TWEDQLGLTRTDFSHKPAYNSFKTYQPTNTGCTYTGIAHARSSAQDPAQQAGTSATTAAAGAPASSLAVVGRSFSVLLRVGRVSTVARSSGWSRARTGQVLVKGRVRGAHGGRLVLRLERRRPGGRSWRRAGTRRARIH